MKLSERLAKIAEIIPDGAYVADIGTDHGYLPIYLAETGKARHVVLCDVNAGPLEKAALNIAEVAKGGEALRALRKPHSLMPKVVELKTVRSVLGGKKSYDIENPEIEWDLRKGDGLAPLEVGEADVCVIAGMGGRLIREILEADPEKTAATKLFVLQPRTEEGMLRAWLREEGYGFYRDCLVREGSFLCQIIAVVPPSAAVGAKTVREQEAEELEKRRAEEEEIRRMKEGPRAPWDATPDPETYMKSLAGEAKTEAASSEEPASLSERVTALCEALSWDVSPLWILENDPLAREYLKRRLEKQTSIFDALRGAKSPESATKTVLMKKEADAAEKLLEIAVFSAAACKEE